jgi:hypothetical protein
MNEKQIDELARMIRDYIKTGAMDVRLNLKMSKFISEHNMTDAFEDEAKASKIINYFLQSVRRELTEPETVRRDPSYTEMVNYP